MKLEVIATLVLVALGLSSCMAVRHRGTSGVEGSNRPVIHPLAPAPEQAQAHSLTAPSAIYVADFDSDPGIVQTSNDLPSRVMQGGGPLSRLRERTGLIRQTDSSDPETEARQAVVQLSQSIVKGLTGAGVAAQRIAQSAPVPPDAWVLRGRIDALSEGNRVKESVVGFGAGEPHVEISGTIDAIQQGSEVTVLTFGDESRTHHMPGGIVTRNPYVIAAKFVLSRGATSRDVQQLGGDLAKEIVGYMRQNGLAR
ncbi:MAG: DUF4410 domain-containing protein [Chromatiales bacterium]